MHIGFSGYFTSVFFPQFHPVFIAIVLIVVLSFVNFYGISESVWINTVFTFIELAGLVIIILAGFWLGSPSNTNYFEILIKHLLIHYCHQQSSQYLFMIGAILGGSGLIFFAYYGFENIVNIADETRTLRRLFQWPYYFNNCYNSFLYFGRRFNFCFSRMERIIFVRSTLVIRQQRKLLVDLEFLYFLLLHYLLHLILLL